MKFLSLLVTSAALAFAIPQDDPAAVPEDLDPSTPSIESVDTPLAPVAAPNGFDQFDQFIPDSITVNQNFPPPGPGPQPWNQPWRQPWRPAPQPNWFPQPAPGPVTGRCQNAFPNGFVPAVGPTDCSQIADPFCNPSGQGFVCSPNYDYIQQCSGGRAVAVQEICQNTLSCTSGIYGAYGGCLNG